MNESRATTAWALRRSIGAKLAVIFLALAIIPMSAIAYFNLTQSQCEVAEATSENLMQLSRGTAHRIEELLRENQRTSAALAGDPAVVQFLSAAEGQRQAMSAWVYHVLRNYADAHPDYDAPGLLDVNGIVVASLDERLMGRDRSFRDYFQAAIQGQPYVSHMLVGRATGRPGVFLTNPVVTSEGEIVGIDIVWLKGDAIWRIIDEIAVGEEGKAYLVDQDGVIIAHPDRDLLYHSLGELTPEAAATISSTIRFGTVEGTDRPLIPPSLGMDDAAAELASVQGSGIYRYACPLDGRDHVVGYTRLEAYPWTVIVDVPEAQFLAPLQRLGWVTLVSVGLVGVLALIVSALLAYGITRPIRCLTDVASGVERGQPFEPADIEDVTSGADEIAQLGRVFADMVLGLRRQQERITHLNLVLRAIRNVNQLIIQEKDRDRLIQAACENLIETRGYHTAWVALLDESERLVTSAEAGLGEAFLPLLDRLKRGELTACGRKALEQPEVVVIQDVPSTCGDCPLVDEYGGRGAMTVRLEHGGKVYGLSSVSIPRHLAGDEEEQALFIEVTRDIAFALHGIEVEEERVQAESQRDASLEALQKSESSLTQAQHIAHVGSWTRDLETNELLWSQETCRIFGVSPEDFGASFEAFLLDCVHPEDREAMLKAVEDGLNTREPYQIEYRIVRPDGEVRIVIEREAVITDESGHPIQIGTVQDITERKRADEALRRSRDEWTSTFDAMSDWVSLLDLEARILRTNAAGEDLVGVPPAEMVGQTCCKLVHGTDEPIPGCPLQKMLGTHQRETVELQVPDEDRWLMITAEPVMDDDGNLIRAVHIVRDITERKRAEEEKENLQAHLLQAQKMEAVGRLTAGIAHDFNNLLTAINGFAQLIQLRLAPDDPVQEMVGRIWASGQRAAGLVSQLMAFSRKQIIDPQVLDLNVVVTDMDDMLRRVIREDVELKTVLAPDLWPIHVDPTQIEQVIVNLAVNAADAMPDGGQLTVETSNVVLDEAYLADHLVEAEPGEHVLLAVSDTGVGMSPEVQARIFEPFFTTKERGEGTGLGLATVYGGVTQNGGHIRVDSQEGQGTTFKIYLPRAEETEELSPRAEKSGAMPAGGETILLAEDEAEVRDLARQVLERQGYTLLEAGDGQQALELAASHAGPIHLLLTDVIMPGMSGSTLSERLVQSHPDVRVLYMSGHTDSIIEHHGVFGKGTAFLQKPFSPFDLARKVRAVLDE